MCRVSQANPLFGRPVEITPTRLTSLFLYEILNIVIIEAKKPLSVNFANVECPPCNNNGANLKNLGQLLKILVALPMIHEALFRDQEFSSYLIT